MPVKIPKIALYPLAVGIAIAAGAAAAVLEIALIHRIHVLLPVFVGAMAGGSVFALADRLNLLPDEPPPLSLFSPETDEQARTGYTGDGPIEPK